MPRLIPLVSVGVSRKTGTRTQTIFPPIGEMFEFTDEEVKQIRGDRPESLRRPINETARASRSAEVTSEEEDTLEDDAPVEEEEDVTQGHTARPMSAQQQRREAAAQAAAARRSGVRRTHGSDEDL